MKGILGLALAGALAVAGGMVAPAAAQDVTLKFGNGTNPAAKEAGELFKKIVEEGSGGAIKINYFPDNQLGDDRVMAETTVFGDLDIAVISTSNMATIINDFYLFDAPYLFLNPKQAYTALDGPTGQKILEGMTEKGVLGLTFWENGFRDLTNSKVAVRLPKDVEGLKIRTMENQVHLAAWKAFGANPTPMAFVELFTALQQGAVDGQENPLGLIDGNKFQDVQQYVSLTQHVYTPYVMMINLDRYNSLTEDQQALIRKAAKETTTFQRDRSQALEVDILKKFKTGGTTVVELTDEDKAAWQQIVKDAKIFDLVKSKMAHPDYLDEMVGE